MRSRGSKRFLGRTRRTQLPTSELERERVLWARGSNCARDLGAWIGALFRNFSKKRIIPILALLFVILFRVLMNIWPRRGTILSFSDLNADLEARRLRAGR